MGREKLDSLGVSAFCESMAMMVQSGTQTDEAIALLRQGDGKGGILEEALAIMQRETEKGKNFSSAMDKAGVFPDYAIRMTAAGETAGRLEEVLFQLARYYADQKTMADKLKNAIVYPAVMLVMVIAVLAIMLTMVLPAFTDVYNNLTGSLTASVYNYIRWSYGLCWLVLGVTAVIAAAFLLGAALWNGGGRNMVEGILRRIPVCDSILEGLGMFRFTSALLTYLASGEMQDIAMTESIKMTGCRPVEEKLGRCVKRMEEGHGIAQAVYDEAIFEPVYGRMLLAGERSGGLEDVFRRLSELLREHCSNMVDRLVGVVDPLLSGILLVTVGLSLLSVMLPLVGMMNSIG